VLWLLQGAFVPAALLPAMAQITCGVVCCCEHGRVCFRFLQRGHVSLWHFLPALPTYVPHLRVRHHVLCMHRVARAGQYQWVLLSCRVSAALGRVPPPHGNMYCISVHALTGRLRALVPAHAESMASCCDCVWGVPVQEVQHAARQLRIM
jgi:hypothetical protein